MSSRRDLSSSEAQASMTNSDDDMIFFLRLTTGWMAMRNALPTNFEIPQGT